MNDGGLETDDRFELEPSGSSTEVLCLSGAVAIDDLPRLMAQLSDAPRDVSKLTLHAIDRIDPSAAALLVDWCEGHDVALDAPQKDVKSLVDVFRRSEVETPDEPERPGTFEIIGRQVADAGRHALEMVAFLGELIHATARGLRQPRSIRWVDLPQLIQRVGADGLGIVCLMSGLLGLVTGYQGAVQLQRFGAASYTANLVGLAMVRELAPLMTAIVVTGRSGAAFAAELATMSVSEEIDALKTMGFSPHGFLVIPRCLALVITAPILTLVADVAAIFGALVVATMVVDASPLTFLLQTQKAVTVSDILAGLVKSVFYAQAIGLIACQQGLSATGGAEGVGRRTTKTVVGALVTLVLIDAVVTIAFHELLP